MASACMTLMLFTVAYHMLCRLSGPAALLTATLPGEEDWQGPAGDGEKAAAGWDVKSRDGSTGARLD